MNEFVQVARLDIAYAKVAKPVDVKKVKATMWSILTQPPPNTVRRTRSHDELVTGSLIQLM